MPLKEINIKPSGTSLSSEIINKIKTEVAEYLAYEVSHINNRTAVSYYLDSNIYDTLYSFVVDQMIFTNHEVFKNGEETLVSHNNVDIIEEEDILDYIESNLELQSYLKQLLITFYSENVDIKCLTNAALNKAQQDQQYFKNDYNLYDIELSVQYAMSNNNCDYYVPDVVTDNDFESFLKQEFNKADLIREVKVTKPIYVKLTSPVRGQIFIEGKPIGLERGHYGDVYTLDEYDEETYNRYGITFDADEDDEDYYPIEESEKLVQILLPKLKHLGAEIGNNGYGVSMILIPEKGVMSIAKADYPIYLGNGKFEYKDKTITYKQASPGSKEYQVYDSNGNLIKTVTSPNKDFNSYMSFLTNQGQTTWQSENSPYGIMKSLTEITIRPNFAINPKPMYGMANTATDIFEVGHVFHLVDLGNYYTILPYGGQPFVLLIPKQYVGNITPLPTHKPLSPKEMDQIKNLINRGKTKIVEPIQTESTKSFKDLLIESYQQKVKSLIKTHLNEAETAYHGSSHYFTSFKTAGVGGGTGTQVYGWGLYFGKDLNIAKGYLGAGVYQGKTKPLFKGKTPEQLGFEYENEVFFGLPQGLKTAQEYIDYATEMIAILEEEGDFEGKQDIINSYKQFIGIIKDLEVEIEPRIYLYKVTLFPGETPDYLDWDVAVPQNQSDKINQQIQKDNLNIQLPPNVSGGELYMDLERYFKSKKAASLFLLKAGIDGTTHSKGSVRIVFDDSKIQIDKIYKSKEIDDLKEHKKLYLTEYSNKVINDMTQRWQKEMKNTLSVDDIKLKIDAFKRIAKPEALGKKIAANQISMPEKFTKPDPKTNKVPNPLDIYQYTWKELEAVLDAYGEKAEKTSKDFATVQDAEFIEIKGVPIVYSGNGIKVYEGSEYGNCIKLNYAFKFKGEDDQIRSYGFCIGRKEAGANQYFTYRFGRGGSFRSFYFVADTTQSADIKGDPTKRVNFLNWYHFFVIHVFDNGRYGVTDAVNEWGSNHEETGGDKGISWEQVGAFMVKHGGESGKKAWEKIKNLKDIFKYVPPTEAETEEAFVQNRILNFDQFKQLSRNQKRIYITARAEQRNAFTSQMFQTLDPELKNLALRTGKGFVPTYNDLRDSKALSRSYASFKFKRAMNDIKNSNRTSVLVPLPFVPYLTEEEKEQYLKTFDGNLTFEYIEKYFGPAATENYVEEQLKKLGFLPKEATKYIRDPKLKQLFNLYSKLFGGWVYSNTTNIGEEELASLTNMPEQTVQATPFTQEQWTSLSKQERTALIELINKFNKNPEYDAILYGAPFIVKDGNNSYALVANTALDPSKFLLMDTEGRVVKDNLASEDYFLGDISLIHAFPDESWNKVFDIKDLKVA